MKKVWVSVVALIGLTMAITTTVVAHGAHDRSQNQTRETLEYTQCTVADCDRVQAHSHNRGRHSGQNRHNAQYENCEVLDGVATGLHEHQGEYYQCQNDETRTPVRSGNGCHKR